jgi:DMSO/TMAO reductase YedYZ molybdopterin-dependent catalytic subunit
VNAGPSRRSLLLGAPGLVGSVLRADQTDVTQADQFFVRDHFEEPDLSLAAWRLRIDGKVKRPLELTFSDLLESPATQQESLLECAGNGESGGAVSMGVWQGVALSSLLQMAGADPAADVLLEGADEGQLLQDSPRTSYLRIVPAKKCRAPGSLVAIKLNGRFLPQRNGFPARVILPGWYGMDSVKWLRRISVLAPREKPAGYDKSGMSQLYSRLRKGQAPFRITSVLVKSVIEYPPKDAKLVAAVQAISGHAWTGDGVIRRVDVSVDGGKSWSATKLETAPRPFTWARWSYSWQARPGEHILMSRAEDSAGNRQPLARDPERLDSYELNWCAPVRCVVG